MGRLTRDPELRNTNSGKPVCNFTVAVNAGSGENQTTDFINCVAWNKMAEFVSDYFSKGKMIIVVGKLQTQSWEDKDGSKRYKTEVFVQEVNFGESKRNEGGTSAHNPADNATQASSGDYNRNGSYTTGRQQRIDDMMGYNGLNDEDDDLPF